MSESIYKNNELENEVSLDMSYFWYSDNEPSRFFTMTHNYNICTITFQSSHFIHWC